MIFGVGAHLMADFWKGEETVVVGVGCWDGDCEGMAWPTFFPLWSATSLSGILGSFRGLLSMYLLVIFKLDRLGGNTWDCGELTRDRGDAMLLSKKLKDRKR